MKPHKNEKITHYNPGQPWLTPKKDKSKAVALHTVHDDVLESTKLHKFKDYQSYFLMDSIEPSPAIEYVDLYEAKVMTSNHIPTDVQWVEGERFVVSKKRIPKKEGQFVFFNFTHFSSQFYFYNHTDYKQDIKDHVEKFLNEPSPVPEISPIILLPQYEEQRRRDLEKSRFAEFIEREVELHLTPIQEQKQRLEKKNQDIENYFVVLETDKANLRSEIIRLQEEIIELRSRKMQIVSTQITLGERPRQFRED